jgi:hypothetical protein
MERNWKVNGKEQEDLEDQEGKKLEDRWIGTKDQWNGTCILVELNCSIKHLETFNRTRPKPSSNLTQNPAQFFSIHYRSLLKTTNALFSRI